MVAARAQDYLRVHQRFEFSIITRYEILRGLESKRAARQRTAFDRFCAASTILSLSDAVVVQAAEIYADLYRRGELIGDADILIAARVPTAVDFRLLGNDQREGGNDGHAGSIG